MGIDSKYFSYCKEIGLMKENRTHQQALDCIIREVKASKATDPAFVNTVSRLTLASPEVKIYSCVLYQYSADMTYVVGGSIKHGKVCDFAVGKGGAPSALQVTNLEGKGEYTVLRDASAIPYPQYNSNAVFTREELNNAMKEHLFGDLPRGTTSYETKNLTYTALIVPVFVVTVYHNGKAYYMYYNLQNGRYSIPERPDDPALIAKGMKAKKIGLLIKLASFVLPLIGFLLSGLGDGTSNPMVLVIPIAAIILNIVIAKKTAKSKEYFERFFIKKPTASIISPVMSSIAMAVVGFIALLLTVAVA